MLSSDLNYLNLAPWAPFIPGALIAVTVGALNALADAYRDRTGPGTLLLPETDPVIKTHSTLTTRRTPMPGSSPPGDDPPSLPGDAPRSPPRGPAVRTARPVLGIEDLHVTVHDGAATALRGVSLGVHAGEIVGLVGESGSGKTLTCRAALGVLPPGVAAAQGVITFAGEDVTALSPRRWERLHGSHIGAVFQDPASYLNPNLTVGSQLDRGAARQARAVAQAGARHAIELLSAVGLYQAARVFHQIPAELSGGMLQRVMIAIAISCDPELLIADEATTALDVTIQAEIIELIKDLRDQRGLAVLFVSHDLAVIRELCDRVVVFYAGEVVEAGPVAEIIERPGTRTPRRCCGSPRWATSSAASFRSSPASRRRWARRSPAAGSPSAARPPSMPAGTVTSR